MEYQASLANQQEQKQTEGKPKKFIHSLSEDLLEAFSNLQLIDKYDVYQHLMTYWMETMQDDCYLIVSDGWKAGNEVEWTKKEFEGKLIPKQILIDRYFKADQNAIEQLEAYRDAITAQLEELEEEHSGEDGYFADFDKVNKVNVQKRINELKPANKKSRKEQEPYSLAADSETAYGEIAVLEQYIKLSDDLSESNKKLKEARSELDKKLLEKYTALTESEIKTLVVEDKWIATIENTVKNEMQRISQRLTQRIKELAERYETPLPELMIEMKQWEEKVNAHLVKMGFVWS
jgi:type I restriction enzyme M protein